MKTFKQLKEEEHHDIELADLNPPRQASETEFYHWFANEIINKSSTSKAEDVIGKIGFLFGAAGTIVIYNLGYLFGKNIAELLGMSPEASEAFAITLAMLILIPRIALSGNTAQFAFQSLYHTLHAHSHLPKKNNHAILRYSGKASALALAGTVSYVNSSINYFYLTTPMETRYALIAISAITSFLITIKPYFDAIDGSLAKNSPGDTEEVRTKRAALLHAVNGALQMLRTMDKEEVKSIRDEMSNERDPVNAFKTFVDLSYEADAPTPPSSFAKLRGILGWITAALAALTVIRATYRASEWITGTDELVPWLAFASVLTFTFLWAGPTQRIFQGIPSSPEWQNTHPILEYILAAISVILGIISSFPHAYWPLVEGESPLEKTLVGPAIASPGALYIVSLSDRLHRMLYSYDECQGENEINELVQFLKRLQTVPAAIANLPDEDILKLVPDENMVQHSLVTHYFNRTATQKALPTNAIKNVV
jgi:hypothetical protein